MAAKMQYKGWVAGGYMSHNFHFDSSTTVNKSNKIKMPAAGEIVAVQTYTHVLGTTPTADLKGNAGTTLLTGVMTPVATTVVTGTLTTVPTTFAQNDIIQVDFAFGATAPVGWSVTIWFRFTGHAAGL